MSSPIDKIILRNFKAFPNDATKIKLESKNLLLYGENGSGKSSIYWSLYTLFQSTTKSATEIAKYFTPNNPENLINLHWLKTHINFQINTRGEIIQPQSIGNNAFVEVYFEDGSMEKIDHSGLSGTPPTGSTLRNLHLTENLNRHSDFIAHRLLINFYNYRNSKEINLWEVFVRDIFPFLMNQSGSGNRTLSQLLKEIETNKPFKLNNADGTFKLSSSRNWQTNYVQLIQDFNYEVDYWIGEINTYVNDFYQIHFEPLYNDKIRLTLDYKKTLNFSKHTKQKYKKDDRLYERWTNRIGSDNPVISLKIETQNTDGTYTIISRPQSYLNEAKLTSIALAIRFSLLNDNIRPPHNGQFIALDDLLISLDMSNRDKVLDIIMEEFIPKYKIYLFTHEKSFFDFCLYKIKQHNDKANWNVQEIYESSDKTQKPIIIPSEYTNQEKAEKYFLAKDYVATSLYLRKEFERVVKERLPAEYTNTVDGEFHNLAHYWKLFREHYKKLSLNMDTLSLNMNQDFEQSKTFILNRQAHHNISEPVYTIELKKVFNLLMEIKRLFPIPETTLILSKGMKLKFSHPTVNYSIEFELLNDLRLDKIGANSNLNIPRCRILTWQYNNTPFWSFPLGVAITLTNPIEHKLNAIRDNHTEGVNVPLSITNDMFLQNTNVVGSIWSLNELLVKSGIVI